MAQKYFSYIPNFDYVSRTPDARIIGEYTTTKNLFKRGVINSALLNNIANFSQYKIEGDDRPDNVARKFYKDSNLDWIVLLTNNIVNIETEWPLTNESFQNYMLDKYGTESEFVQVHHYESVRILDSTGDVIVPGGLEVPENFSISFYDEGLQQQQTISRVLPVTNFEYESKLEDSKRNIYLLKDFYVGLVIDELEQTMPYLEGSSQYVSRSLVRGENIRMFE